jgi:hypothetical protein
MTKGGRTGVPPPQSPAKAAGPATKYSPSPKKEKEGKKGDINSLTAMVADMRPLFFKLRASLITFPIFVC